MSELNETLMTKSEWEAQAIKDGWVKLSLVRGLRIRNEGDILRLLSDENAFMTRKYKDHLTGQQWLNNFKQRIPAWSEGDKTAKSFEKIYLEAAKNASGVE